MSNNITAKGWLRMNPKKSLPLVINCFAMILICKTSFAQNKETNLPQGNYRATHWTINDGLSSNDSYFILKDIKGFVWISGHGLNRLDGNTFKYYFSDTSQRTSLPGNDIQGLIEDSLHNIWIGTTKGLSRYDMKADTFTNFSSSGGLMPTLYGVVPFWATKEELLCFDYNLYSVVSYNVQSFAKKIVTKLSLADSMGIRGTKFFYSIFDEKTNCIWMLPERSQGELLQISLTDGKRKYYPWPVYKKNRGDNHYTGAEAMILDSKRNCIWINSPEGLIYFTLSDKQFHRIDALNQFTDLKDYDRLVGIDFDTKGRIWFATQPKGIIIYNPADQSVEVPFPNDSAMQINTALYNACLYCDRDGFTWTGSWLKTAVYQLAPFSRTVTHYLASPDKPHSLSDNAVIRFAQGDKGKIWIGTYGAALNIFDPATGKFETLTVKDLEGIRTTGPKQGVVPIYIDTILRKAWIESSGGIYEMDMNTKKCVPFVFKDSAGQVINLSGDDGVFSLKFRDGLIIIANHNNRHIIFFGNTELATAQQLLSFPVEEITPYVNIINEDMISFMLEPGDKGHLTYRYTNNKLIRTPIPLDSIQWNEAIYNKQDMTYWVASQRQLFHYNKDFRITRRYTPKDGLPQRDISCMSLDKKNNLWFHTDHSIHQLNTETGGFAELSEKDGFERMDFLNYPGSLRADNGDIYFATGFVAQGFVHITPDKFVSPPSSVFIDEIAVNQKPLEQSVSANFMDQLSLRYFQNKINISTGVIDFFSGGKSRIRYKLEGQDSNWQYSSYYSTIRYERLPTGKKYNLQMQASNASNEFNGPVKSLLIYISPAFWETWWFRIAALLFLSALFYAIVRWRLQQKFRLQLERSEKEIQIAEIKQKATELEMQALRAQMNPHFIFNSLNSINRFILQNNRNQASEYLTKFSKLVRMILQNSQSHLITLESELESLGLYLEMEALRFNYHFDYKISLPKDLDIEVLKVPPLILQPYVENAIWHGLMHKEEKGQLNIDISQEDDHLYFKVIDNGIGRKKASELASKSATKHKSMGLRITAHRIAMMQNTNGLESPVKINDLADAEGNAAGTEVVIKMPVLYD